MTGLLDEKEFEEKYASKLTLEGLGRRIKCPFHIIAGEDENLSPVEYTYEFYSELAGPKRLVVFEGQGHSVLHPQVENIMNDFVADVFQGKTIQTESILIETSGKMVKNWKPGFRRD
jgi:pimeloyl-ACP methyl ester carboxylesterase